MAALSFPAQAQEVCGDRKEIIARLENGYQEHQKGVGLSANGGVVELFVAPSGSWTLMVTNPSGISCLIAAGDGWQTVERASGTPITF